MTKRIGDLVARAGDRLLAQLVPKSTASAWECVAVYCYCMNGLVHEWLYDPVKDTRCSNCAPTGRFCKP